MERVGIDHVGIGSDYTHGQTKEWFDALMSQQGTKPLERRKDYPDVPGHPEGLETPDKMPAIVDVLVVRGFSSDDITKILDGNWLRLLTQVWR